MLCDNRTCFLQITHHSAESMSIPPLDPLQSMPTLDPLQSMPTLDLLQSMPTLDLLQSMPPPDLDLRQGIRNCVESTIQPGSHKETTRVYTHNTLHVRQLS